MAQSVGDRISTSSSYLAPKRVGYIQIWLEEGNLPLVSEGQLLEDELPQWLDTIKPDRSSDQIVCNGGLRLLYGYGYTRDGRDDLNLPFNEATFQLIKEAFHLPPNFSKLLEEESTRCSRTTWFDADGNIEGLGIAVKYFSWWLATFSLGLSYNHKTKMVSGLLLGAQGEESAMLGGLIRTLKSKIASACHPLFLPLLLCEIVAVAHSKEVDIATKNVFDLESSIGMNDYPEHAKRNAFETFDFSRISRSLNGETSRLANYEKWISSHIELVKAISKYEGTLFVETGETQRLANQLQVELREYGEYLLGWNVDLLARTVCQQKIVQAQIQTVYNLLAQRDNKLNMAIAAASKRDSSAMKTIAVVTMVFLPGAYIATLFSMSMFNWHAKDGDKVLSDNFWIYWAFTLPVTALVLLVWATWSRPWKSLF